MLFDPKNIIITDNPPISPIGVANATFAFNPSDTSYITPASITILLDTQSSVVLQANNDITVSSPIVAFRQNNGAGDLTLQAGRNILFNANITTSSSNLTAVAGDSHAQPANREPGIPTLTISPGVSLNVAFGTATLAARDGIFNNGNGDQAILTDSFSGFFGRWHIYAADPGTSTEGFSSYNKHYNEPFNDSTLPTAPNLPAYVAPNIGNWFLYSVAPIISMAPSSQTMTYGTTLPAFSPIYSGFIDGDAVGTAGISGTPAWAIAGPTSSSGRLTAGSHDVAYTGGLSSDVANGLGYQFANNTSSTSELTVSRAPVAPTGITAQDKTYDGTTAVILSGGSLSGVAAGDSVSLSGATAAFNNKNVGNSKPINLSAISFTGADADNYVTANLPGGLGSQGSTGGRPLTASITPASLTYVADPATRVTGVPITDLTGGVTGFLGTDTQRNDTVGVLTWTTPATAASPTGIYAINGGGLTAANYNLVQAASNATALTMLSDILLKELPKDVVTPTDRAKEAALPIYPPYIHGTVDRTSPVEPNFGRLDLSRMSRKEMQQLIDMRTEFKEKLFAEAIYKLNIDPSLADVRPCSSLAKADSGLCKVTNTQLQEYQSKMALEEEPHVTYRTSLARLPQIERKVTVMFGIDQYTDPAIPPLENAISDAEVVGKLFADKLGYEVRVARNATKADIVRTLNQLAMEMQPHDSVTIYYAGHGYLDEKTASGYWIPADATVSDPRSWISNADISKMLSLIRSKQVMVISDSCYSGAFTREQKLSLSDKKIDPDEVLAKRSVVVMSAGGNEPVADGGRQGHSIFAWYLMEALRKVDNWQPGTSLFQQVQREVRQSFPQTPQYGGAKSAGHQAGGDYLFEFRELERM